MCTQRISAFENIDSFQLLSRHANICVQYWWFSFEISNDRSRVSSTKCLRGNIIHISMFGADAGEEAGLRMGNKVKSKEPKLHHKCVQFGCDGYNL